MSFLINGEPLTQSDSGELKPAQASFSSLPLELKEKILLDLDNESFMMMQQVSEDWNTNKFKRRLIF